MADKLWYLKNCHLFERLPQDFLARLESRSKYRQFPRKSLIYLPSDQSDSVLLLASGRVKLYHVTAEGKQTLLAFIDPGELFGELTVFAGDGQREEFAETLEPSSVVLIPGAEIRKLIEKHPVVSIRVTRLMGLRRRRMERRLKSLLFCSNRDRLVYLLIELAEKYGQPDPEGVRVGTKFSHQELASAIGTTRETVTNLLSDLRSEGAIAIRRRQIVLKKAESLAASIDEPPPAYDALERTARAGLRHTPLET